MRASRHASPCPGREAAWRRHRRGAALAPFVAFALLASGCSGSEARPTAADLPSEGSPAVEVAPESGATAATRGRPPVTLKPLAKRYRSDVLVVGNQSFSPDATDRLRKAAPSSVLFRAGTVRIAGQDVRAVGVDPATFRSFTAEGTAEATAVWQAVARGEAVLSHTAGTRLKLALGQRAKVSAVGAPGHTGETLRIGALATTGVPSTELIVDDATGKALGLRERTGMLLSGFGRDPVTVADAVRRVTGDGAKVDLLTAPASDPVAFLSGSRAAKAFGAFSYRYYPDGTIEPDASWVRENIQTTAMPIFGRVSCHRLMIPQLRGALEDVVEAGLASHLTTYDGCYVPRFIERNPERSISLHTWGIAIDFDAATNYRGIRGTMHPDIVRIFKSWGFRWGGDWAYTDPMHFELSALLSSPR